jgi:hypothetical protein
VWLLASPVIAGTACDYWHHAWLLVLRVEKIVLRTHKNTGVRTQEYVRFFLIVKYVDQSTILVLRNTSYSSIP